jgi:hypothetical protein
MRQHARLLLQQLVLDLKLSGLSFLFGNLFARRNDVSLLLLAGSREFVDPFLLAASSLGLSLSTPQKSSGKNSPGRLVLSDPNIR